MGIRSAWSARRSFNPKQKRPNLEIRWPKEWHESKTERKKKQKSWVVFFSADHHITSFFLHYFSVNVSHLRISMELLWCASGWRLKTTIEDRGRQSPLYGRFFFYLILPRCELSEWWGMRAFGFGWPILYDFLRSNHFSFLVLFQVQMRPFRYDIMGQIIAMQVFCFRILLKLWILYSLCLF